MTVVARPILISFTIRTAVFWVVARIAFAITEQAAYRVAPPPTPQPLSGTELLSVGPATAVIIAAAVVALVLHDVRAIRERAFLANLGVGLQTIGIFAFTGAISLEIGLAILLRTTG